MELEELRKIAEAATPGPWEVMDPSGCASWIAAKRPSRKFVGKGMSEQDAEHIATLDPPAVLALLSRIEQAEQDRDKLMNRLDAMRRQRDGYRNQLRKTEQQIQRVREVAAEYRPSIPEEVLHEVMKDILRALDGDGRG